MTGPVAVLLAALVAGLLPGPAGVAAVVGVALAVLLSRREPVSTARLLVLAAASVPGLVASSWPAGAASAWPNWWLAVALAAASATHFCRERALPAFAAIGATAAALTCGRFALAATDPTMAFSGGAGLLTNPNHLAAFVELVLPVALWCALTQERSRLMWSVVAGLLAAIVVAAGSRAGTALVVIEIAVFTVLTRRDRRARAVRMTCFVAAAAGLAAGGAGLLLTRIAGADYISLRVAALQATVRMIADRPLAGWGGGSWEHVYPAFAARDFGAAVLHAHNDWLEFAAEYGIPFGAAAVVAAAALSRRALRIPWALGVPAVFLHALVESPLHNVTVAVWTAILATLCCSPTMVIPCGSRWDRSTVPSAT